jgi:Glycogen recognition site of AMP-activated protein kinase
MPDETRWSDDAQRYLDGAGPLPDDPREREQAARLEAAFADYASALPPLDGRLDARVMAALARGPRAARTAWWRWFVEPRLVPLRPVLAAAAVLALVALTSVVTIGVGRRGRDASPAPAAGAGAVPPGTVLVRFELEAPDAGRVTLAGSFNEWSDSSIVFSRAAGGAVWSVTVALPPGRYQYLFVVDGNRWIPDPAAHAQVADEFGQQNSLLVVGPRGVVRS